MINRQRGVALLMVLFILALMMILASAMTERTAVMYQHTAVTLDNLQARWYALAAENMAAALLQSLPWLAEGDEGLNAQSNEPGANLGAGGAPLYPRRWRNPRHDPRRARLLQPQCY